MHWTIKNHNELLRARRILLRHRPLRPVDDAKTITILFVVGQQKMETSDKPDGNQAVDAPDHLCVLIHGYVSKQDPHPNHLANHIILRSLWGNPSHMSHLASALRSHPSSSSLRILIPSSNAGHFTYDGIETCAERVTSEIQSFISSPAGTSLTKISIIGYSLGGLVARYCVGLLFSTGVFEKLTPLNFNTFATPHVGVRSPLGPFPGSLGTTIFNALGPRTLSASGRQMWMIDTFRDTGQPILSVMADRQSIFMRGLRTFKTRALYANAINDRTVNFYTAMIWKVDPFRDLDNVDVNYTEGWEPLIVDSERPVMPKKKKNQPEEEGTYYSMITSRTMAVLKTTSLVGAVAVLIPLGSTIFLINAGVQAVRSSRRIRLHEAGKAGIELGRYRIPLMIEEARNTIGATLSRSNTRDEEVSTSSALINGEKATEKATMSTENGDLDLGTTSPLARLLKTDDAAIITTPQTLALLPQQLEMIDSLNELSWRKFPVHIQAVRHTHAAIVVRTDRKAFDEGRRTARHWVEEVFEV